LNGSDGLLQSRFLGRLEQEDERNRIRSVALGLKNAGDADFFHAKDAGDLGEHPRLISDLKADIETADRLTGLDESNLVAARRKNRSGRLVPEVAGGLAEIRQQGAGGGIGSGTPACELDGTGEIPNQADRVENPVNGAHGMPRRDQGGSDPDFNAIGADRSDHGEELNDVAELPGERDILRLEFPDSFDRDPGKGGKKTVAEQAKNRGLVGGIDAVHVQTIVRFGVTEFFRLAQGIGKARPFLGHSAEDVVAGAVDDAVHA